MIKTIIFDFDGVIVDSMNIKSEAFRAIFAEFPKDKVELLVQFHLENGGMSRYEKIRYFFSHIINQVVAQGEIDVFVSRFADITSTALSDKKYLIKETMDFIKCESKNKILFIASGSDEKELRYLCDTYDISKYFKGIFGSPKNKNDIIADILSSNNLLPSETILIGDSVNDYEAAKNNKIGFYGYGNQKLQGLCGFYIKTFLEFMI